jgi:hypothetical protein
MKQFASFALLLWAAPVFAQTLKVDTSANPAAAGSSQVNWSVTHDGKPLLSWLEPLKDGGFALRYSEWNGTVWSGPRTITAHRKFFHHPAEVPGMVTLGDGTLVAHWIEQPSETSEAEFVYVSTSHDGINGAGR